MITRHQDWPVRLAHYLESRKSTPFEYGVHDCALFAADWVIEATGSDPLGGLRGLWTDEQSAMLLIQEISLRERVAQALWTDELAPLLAQRGDLILHDLLGREGIGICVGDKFAAPAEELGFRLVPMKFAIAAWRI
jgi:hypothetical protein